MVNVGIQIVLACWIAAVSATIPTSSEQDLIVSTHNKHRGLAGASDMMELTWDAPLANSADRLVNDCKDTHSLRSELEFRDGFYSIGENLFSASEGSTLDLEYVVDYWHSEKVNYTYSSNICKVGQICGHYTQVVWASTYKVGCAYNTQCDNPRAKIQVACQYGSGGNLRNEKPYTEGTGCSKCPNGKDACTSDKKLCTGTPPCADKSSECDMYASGGICPVLYKKWFALNCKKTCSLCEYM